MKYKLHLTLNSALKFNPCQDGLIKFKEYLDENGIGPDEPVNLLVVLKNNGIVHCLWALRACLEIDVVCKVSVNISSNAATRAARAAARADAADAASAAYAAYAGVAAAYAARAAARADAADAADAAAYAADAAAYAADAAAYAADAAYAARADAADAADAYADAAERENQKQDLLDLLEYD